MGPSAQPLRPGGARVFVLLPTIPARRAACEALLAALLRQSRPPDRVILCLDGYGAAPAPERPAPLRQSVIEVRRQGTCGGPGHRWRTALGLLGPSLISDGTTPAYLAPVLQDDDLLVSLDDDADLSEAPNFLNWLIVGALAHGAAAATGLTPKGHRAPPGEAHCGPLLLGCGCGLALRARHLVGLPELAAEVLRAGGPDALGALGDDQALVSAHLWRQRVALHHAATGRLRFAPGTDASAQWMARRAGKAPGKADPWDQARAIARITGWPLRVAEGV